MQRSTLRAAAAAAAPIVALLAVAWSRRWTADDGFINFRVVDQLLAGNGPVFNAGERVEVATSPAWIVVLVVMSRVLFFLPLEWVSVVCSLALAVAALAMAALGALRLRRGDDAGLVVPVGLLAFVAIRPVWDFTTSGLEVSLSLAWLAGCFLVLSRRRAPGAWAAVLLGLGPLVRPDFAVFSGVFLIAMVVLARPSMRRAAGLLAAALALPVLFQLFRMGYYAALVPNTAFAKEASRTNWSQGWYYAKDFVGTYGLYVPVALAAAAGAFQRWTRDAAVVALAFPVAAAVHWLYVIRVGGDFMHGRLLIPGLFAALLPVAVVPVRRVAAVAALGVAVWAVVAAASLKTDYRDGIWGPRFLADERAAYVNAARRDDPVTIEDYQQFTWPRYGAIAREAAERDEAVVLLEEDSFYNGVVGVNRLAPKEGGPQTVVVFGYIGMVSYAAGPEVWVVDRLGLGDPVASRVALLKRSRPGHEKELHLAWPIARFVTGDIDITHDFSLGRQVEAARRALACDPLDEILDAVTEPLTPGRFVENFKVALTTYGARISGNPEADATAFCGN